MNFNQCYFSKTLDFFKKGAFKSWECTEYSDTNKPAIFVGLYTLQDVEMFKNHKSYRLLILGGADTPNLNLIDDFTNTFSIMYATSWVTLLEKRGVVCKPHPWSVRCFDDVPVDYELGDKIYVYSGNHLRDYLKDASGQNKGLFNQCIKPLIDKFGIDRFIFAKQLPMKDLIEDVYKKAFIFIKPNEWGGLTSMWELAHMGRKTITSSLVGCPNTIEAPLSRNNTNYMYPTVGVQGYEDIEKVIGLIEKEEATIGKKNTEISRSSIDVLSKTSWKNLEYWI